MNKVSTREQIITAADELFYEQGFEHTSFSDIANIVEISRGNFYYHFKTKDEILAAVIQHRVIKTQAMLDKWENDGDTPLARIICFVNILITNRSKIKLYGCPVGTLSNELAKLDHQLLNEANELFSLFRDWLKKQFLLLGQASHSDSLAMHVLAFSQGVATLANAFNDENFIKQEVKRMEQWLNDLKTTTKV